MKVPGQLYAPFRGAIVDCPSSIIRCMTGGHGDALRAHLLQDT